MPVVTSPAPFPGTLETARTSETRRRILEAAAQCFARFGFSRTRMDDVAGAAGVSRALVHGYFGTKPGLLRAVQEHVVRSWSAALEEMVSRAPGPAEAIEAWVRNSLSDTGRRPLLRAIFSDEAMAASGDWVEVTARTRREALGRLERLLAEGVQRGEFRADLDVPAAADVLRTLQNGLLQNVFADPPRSEIPVERQVDATLSLMFAGLGFARPA